MRPATVVAVVLLAALAPTSALDWTGSQEYGAIGQECRQAVERATIWWFAEGNEHLNAAFDTAYPVLFAAERMDSLASRVPLHVPASSPADTWPAVRIGLLLYPTFRDVNRLLEPILHETVYQGLAPVTDRDVIREKILGLVEAQDDDGSWGRWREEKPEETASAVELLLRVLQFRDVVGGQLGLDDTAFSEVREAVERGMAWLLGHQGSDGGFDQDPADHARVISTLIDVYRLADRLGLDVDRDGILNAVRKGLEWLFSAESGVTWEDVDGSHGPVWTRNGSPDVRTTGDVLRFALLKALWYDIATDVEVDTPGGKRKLRDLIEDPEYDLHATVRWLLKGQVATTGPEYGSWSDDEGTTAAAMGALEAYLNPRVYYDGYWRPADVRAEMELFDVTERGTTLVLRYRVTGEVESLKATFYEDYGYHGCYEVWSGELRSGEGVLTIDVDGHTLYVFRIVARYRDGTVDDVFAVAGLKIPLFAGIESSDTSPVRVKGSTSRALLVSGGLVGEDRDPGGSRRVVPRERTGGGPGGAGGEVRGLLGDLPGGPRGLPGGSAREDRVAR